MEETEFPLSEITGLPELEDGDFWYMEPTNFMGKPYLNTLKIEIRRRYLEPVTVRMRIEMPPSFWNMWRGGERYEMRLVDEEKSMPVTEMCFMLEHNHVSGKQWMEDGYRDNGWHIVDTSGKQYYTIVRHIEITPENIRNKAQEVYKEYREVEDRERKARERGELLEKYAGCYPPKKIA